MGKTMRNFGNNLGLFLAILAFLGFGTIYVLWHSIVGVFQPQPIAYITISNSTITGSFNATGNGTSIDQITLYGENKTQYHALISGSSFTVTLPNKNASYNVTATWNGIYSWEKGTVASTSPFTFSTSDIYASQRIIFQTQDSFIISTGTASTKWFPLAWASSIEFTPTNESFQPITANVNYGSYIAKLPNFVTYSVTEYYAGVPSGNCSEGTYQVKVTNGAAFPKGNWTC